MANVPDQDRYFLGQVDASIPSALLSEGVISRLINGAFIKGAITNAIGFREIPLDFFGGKKERVWARKATYQNLLDRGEPQVFAGLSNAHGKYLVFSISGKLFKTDISTKITYDITPKDSFLPESSRRNPFPLSYIDNDGGVQGVGGYLVIFNYPHKPIFVGIDGARLSDSANWETPASRMGVTGGSRAAVVSGENLLYLSDPLGGSSPLAPLQFRETLESGADFDGQIFSIGSVLDVNRVTAIARMISLYSPAAEFLATAIIIFTEQHKYLFSIGLPRDAWEGTEVLRYAGSTEGASGPLAVTNMGNLVTYTTSEGRIKSIAQDAERDNSLSEMYFDAPLGQFLCCNESQFHFRPWYKTLDHSRSVLRFVRNRLYATVSPIFVDAVGQDGEKGSAYSHRALAVANLSDNQAIGSQGSIMWECFYDWIYPNSITVLGKDLYIFSKDLHGKNRLYVQDFNSLDPHDTTVYTRGYFGSSGGISKSLLSGDLFFRVLNGNISVSLDYLIDGVWQCGFKEKPVTSKLFRFKIESRSRSNSASIPLRVTIHHNGCRFELAEIKVNGEVHTQERG